MRRLVGLIASLSLAGCASAYKAPGQSARDVTVEHGSTQSAVFKAARRALVLEGFQIQSFDGETGIISTSRKVVKLSPDDADCGSTMGINYLLDDRTKTEAALNVVVGERSVTISSIIEGEYLPGAAVYGRHLQCVSLGVLEERIAASILEAGSL